MVPLIDLHTHLLPGVDDGADSTETALAMLELAYKDGIRTICFTPHYHPGRNLNSAGAESVFREFTAAAAKQYPDVTFLLGEELFYHQDLTEALARGLCRSLNGTRNLLVEFTTDVEPSYLLTALLKVRSCGYLPVLAHAERYDCLLNDAGYAEKIAENGFPIQLNASSVLGECGFRIRHFCRKLLRRRIVSLIATDAHDTKDRPPLLSSCYRLICQKYGEEYANELFFINPAGILELPEEEQMLPETDEREPS